MRLDTSIANLRVEYSLKTFNEQDLIKDPFQQFSSWFDEAVKAKVNEPNAMTLATVKPDGTPSARIVLLKGIQENGLVFFTNYDSHKGQEMAKNTHVAVVFCWLELQRQVRVEGIVRKVSAAESDQYFYSRPAGSQIGAHASPQSSIIDSREVLEKRFEEMQQLFSKQPIIRPQNWGGYLIEPSSFEFWQGRQSRLHDRFLYSQLTDKEWKISRLAP